VHPDPHAGDDSSPSPSPICLPLPPISLATPQGTLTSYSPDSGKFTVKYDDGQTEQLLLEGERVQWHAPRGATAGYTPARHAAMAGLGVEGLAPAPVPAPGQGPGGPGGAERVGGEVVGWRMRLWFGGSGTWHDGEVRRPRGQRWGWDGVRLLARAHSAAAPHRLQAGCLAAGGSQGGRVPA
jgi:hypothetical protein